MIILLPQTRDTDGLALAAKLAAQRPLRPFGPEARAFIAEFSRRILTTPAMREHPEFMALAHWMRGARLEALQQEFARRSRPGVTAARGLVLHFAPANVDSIFLYSWFLALLAGNANIIRISERARQRIEPVLAVLTGLLDGGAHGEIRARTMVVSYEHDEAITAALSQLCHVRVIWGGDETVRRIRSIPLAPHATEVAFPDRFSMAVFKASAINALEAGRLAGLLERFANDALLFDQAACSSPRLVVWVGEAQETASAQARFWSGFAALARERTAEWAEALAMRRLTSAYLLATEPETTAVRLAGADGPARVEIKQLAESLRTAHEGTGLFLEMSILKLEELSDSLTPRDQTMVSHGFSSDELVRWCETLPARALDRIVPVGQALDFHPVWDGHDLLSCFTREIVIINPSDLPPVAKN